MVFEFTPETTLFTRILDDPLDEAARLEYEAVLRSQSPQSREVRYLELERQLSDVAEEPERFADVLSRLDELQRNEFTWDDRLWTDVIPRRFDVWLDCFDPSLALAVENALRLRCDIMPGGTGKQTPFVIVGKRPALECDRSRSGIHEFICRYEHRLNDEIELAAGEVVMTIRPAWSNTPEHRPYEPA